MDEAEFIRRVKFYRVGKMTDEAIARQLVKDYYRLTGESLHLHYNIVLDRVKRVK